ncbi:glucosylceramidase [Cephus cinctus]|uniref:Glucosylceramidase n=1 Tax=Cephus cinctus TaxID=211228 RepID=A0AAJ7FP77_CEPCN|nr:glucosylceramidase [Cephus cinctus]
MRLPAAMRYFLLLASLVLIVSASDECIPRDFGNDGTVCVCNSTYCDVTPEPSLPKEGSYLHYVSSKRGQRFNQTTGEFSNEPTSELNFNLNRSLTYQSITGFGGAFSDSAGINIKNLSQAAQNNLMEAYFGVNGSRYNFGRIPIGGSDFSTRKYTYDDSPDDISLAQFALADEDLQYKIPLMQKALELNPDLKFLAAPWTAPPWMKTNNDYNGIGFLKKEYYQLYTDYLIKFMDAYKDYGLEMWSLSTGNEPFNGLIPIISINSMGWTPSSLSNWISNNLGPTLRASPYNATKILTLDDQQFELPWFIAKLFKDPKTKNYTDGVAFHWYWDNLIGSSVLDATHDEFPDKFLIMTEACAGAYPTDVEKVMLGSWTRGESYILDIIENLSHWTTGWIEWNLALNEKGGPSWTTNFVDSSIIVNAENDEFYKQPTYYALAHFSKFIPRNSVRIDLPSSSDIKSVAFITPTNDTVIVLYNKNGTAQDLSIKDPNRGYINVKLPGSSIHTIIYK